MTFIVVKIIRIAYQQDIASNNVGRSEQDLEQNEMERATGKAVAQKILPKPVICTLQKQTNGNDGVKA
jgi:hypothetical protein